jgi:multiple antibiotic resistance protein
MSEFWLCFVPLFVAVDAIGVLPLFISLTEGLERRTVFNITLQSIATAAIVTLAFLALGKVVLGLLGVTVADFMIAGGILLFVISLGDILSSTGTRQRILDHESLGAVPLGVPLLAGPAVLTTSILLASQHGIFITGLAVIINIAIAGVVFMLAPSIHRTLGKAGAKTVSKISSLILAAIGVMMIRRGLEIFISSGFSPKL